MQWLQRMLIAALMLGACAAPPSESIAPPDTAGAWQLMPNIKVATFSAGDPRQYNVMIFCDPPGHVRIYHYVQPEALGGASNLVLRSGAAHLELEAQREEDRATPPPVSSDAGPLLGVSVHARLSREEGVMRAFFRTGALEVTSGAHTTRADADARERNMLANNFFAHGCA